MLARKDSRTMAPDDRRTRAPVGRMIIVLADCRTIVRVERLARVERLIAVRMNLRLADKRLG